MFINFQEFFNVIPIIIIATGIVFSLLIEMYSKKSEVFLPWFSVLMFLAAGLHSLFYTNDVSIILQGMLATGGNVNVFHAIFTFGAAVVTLLSIDYIKKIRGIFWRVLYYYPNVCFRYDVNGRSKGFICNLSWSGNNVCVILHTCWNEP